MSKSKGNVVNPLKLTEKYGTDALRMALTVGNTPGTDLALQEDKVKAYKLFANKIWNVTRFVLSREKKGGINQVLKTELLTLTKDVTEDMENYRFYLAAEKLYHYMWHTFADKIIEESKQDENAGETLYYILETCLKLLHPFMPFITEEIWSEIPHESEQRLLLVTQWPK